MAEDRITKMLTANSPGVTSDLGEFATTLGSALVGKKGFGEALNEIRAGYLAQQAAAQQMEMAPRKQALAEQKHVWDQLKFAAQQKDKYAKSMMDAIKLVVPNEDDARLVSERMHTYPDDITTGNATQLATQATNELVAEGTIEGRRRYKDTEGSWRKIYDEESPTKYSWENLKTGQKRSGAPPTGGISAKFNPETGDFEVTTGPQMEKKTKGTLEQQVLNATNGLVRVGGIKAAFKPEYQQIQTRWDAWKTGMQEKVEGIPGVQWLAEQLGEGDRELLRDFSVYRRRALENLNLYIKEITGAQLSRQEADRLTRAMPNPGKGLLDGDSPTVFYAKLLDIEKDLKKATARYVYALRNGLNPLVMNLDEIQDLMARRWGDVYDSLPEGDDDIRSAKADEIVGKEFGLTFGM